MNAKEAIIDGVHSLVFNFTLERYNEELLEYIRDSFCDFSLFKDKNTAERNEIIQSAINEIRLRIIRKGITNITSESK